MEELGLVFGWPVVRLNTNCEASLLKMKSVDIIDVIA